MTVRFSVHHLWARRESVTGVQIGITPYAQETLGDVVFLELPAVGTTFTQGEIVGTIESVKTASDLIAPIDFTVVEVNEDLLINPSLANSDPLGAGWLFRATSHQFAQWEFLLDAHAYEHISNPA